MERSRAWCGHMLREQEEHDAHRPWTSRWATRGLRAAVFLTAVITGTGLPGGVAATPRCRAVRGHETCQVQPSGALTIRCTGGLQGQSVLTDHVYACGGLRYHDVH